MIGRDDHSRAESHVGALGQSTTTNRSAASTASGERSAGAAKISASGICVALLAAGRSTRFGTANKLTATLGNRPLIAWAAQAGQTLKADHHFLIAPADIPLEARSVGYHLLINTHPEQGMSRSLQIAAQAAQEAGARALIILLADMPFITPTHLRRLAGRFQRDDGHAIFSRASGRIAQPPALFPAAHFPALRALEGDRGARSFARDAALLDCDANQLLDIDTPDDLEAAQRLLSTFTLPE